MSPQPLSLENTLEKVDVFLISIGDKTEANPPRISLRE